MAERPFPPGARFVAGAEKKPDGTLDLSRAAYLLDEEGAAE